jgi:hypothetical protein
MLNLLKKHYIGIYLVITIIFAISSIAIKNILFTTYSYYVTYAYDIEEGPVGLEGVNVRLDKPITKYADVNVMVENIKDYMLKNNSILKNKSRQKVVVVVVNYSLLDKE